MRTSRAFQTLGRVKAFIKGRPVETPSQVTGEEIRRALALTRDRMVILRPASGGVVRQVPDHELVQIQDGDEFDDVPVGRWG